MPYMAYVVTVVREPAALRALLPEWEELAAHTLEPNLFHEPWMMLPALEAFADPSALKVALVRAGNQLCGVFPLETAGDIRGLPYPHLRIWRHRHCMLGTPLVRAGHARECIAALLDWLETDPQGAGALEWSFLRAEGPFAEVLEEVLDDTDRPRCLLEAHARGLLRPRASAEDYLAEALPAHSRHELRRLERRLSERGRLDYSECSPGETAQWIEEFVALEAAGWKGRRGSALGSTEANRVFFTRAAAEAARRGRLMILALRLDGRAVAMKLNFLAGEGSYAFKIAYDEAFRRYSPGTLLEAENIRRFHARPALRWMDSCAGADHFMVNRLWVDRLPIQAWLIATGRAPGRLVVSALPAMRWLYRTLRGKKAA